MKRYTEGHAKTPMCWTEVGERRMFGSPIVQETMIKLETIQANMKKAQDRQKKYADQSRREVIFEIGDWVYLKVTAQKGKDRFGKVGKHNEVVRLKMTSPREV